LHQYIDYSVVSTSSYSAVLYVAATCGALLLSGKHLLFVWGLANAAAVGVLSLWASNGLPSLGCMWAACTSFVIAVFLRRVDAAEKAGRGWPWEARGLYPSGTVVPSRSPGRG
jgi:hypothetical protein